MIPGDHNPRRYDQNVSDAARILGASVGTVRRWTDEGHIHHVRTPGGQRRYSRNGLTEFVRELEHGATPANPDLIKEHA